MRDRNEWFKEAKGALRHLEIEAVENPFAWPTVACVADGEDVLHALGLHPSRDVGGMVNVDESEVLELAELISPEPVTGSTSDGYHTFDELYHHRAVLFSVIVAMFRGRSTERPSGTATRPTTPSSASAPCGTSCRRRPRRRCLDHRISASDEAAGPTRRPVAVVMRRDGRLQEVDPWRVVIDDSEEVFGMYSWMWDEESVVCEQLGLAGVKADRGGDE